MAIEDYFDPYDSDDDEKEEVECNRCGSTNVYWSDRTGSWRLYEDEGNGRALHSCEQATEDDFEVVE